MRIVLTIVTAVVAAGSAGAHAGKKLPGRVGNVTGEVVDMACYTADGDRGASHKKCALLCARKGIPIAILDRKGNLTLLLPNHDDERPYEDLKQMAAETVTVKGHLVRKGGVPAVIVDGVTPPAGWKPAADPKASAAGTPGKPYVCPMRCDGLSFDKPGRCPVCGMDLVKVEKQETKADPPAEKKAYFCTMDADVQSDNPGLCPKCGMDLEKRKT